MKSSQLLRILLQDGWFKVSQSGSHIKLKHPTKPGIIIFPSHGSHEIGKGLERDLLRKAGIKKAN